MPRGIDEIHLVLFSVLSGVIQRHTLRLNGNATLAFQIHRIQHLVCHLAISETAASLNQPVCQG